jgi:hypothetical protein
MNLINKIKFLYVFHEGTKLKNSKLVKSLLTDEILLMLGIGLSILGFYVMAEWQIIAGLLVVFFGYGLLLTTTKKVKKAIIFFILKIKTLNQSFSILINNKIIIPTYFGRKKLIKAIFSH